MLRTVDIWAKEYRGRCWKLWANDEIWQAVKQRPWLDWLDKLQNIVYVDPRYDAVEAWRELFAEFPTMSVHFEPLIEEEEVKSEQANTG